MIWKADKNLRWWKLSLMPAPCCPDHHRWWNVALSRMELKGARKTRSSINTARGWPNLAFWWKLPKCTKSIQKSWGGIFFLQGSWSRKFMETVPSSLSQRSVCRDSDNLITSILLPYEICSTAKCQPASKFHSCVAIASSHNQRQISVQEKPLGLKQLK